ncbi:MAG: aminomethyl-transferring glycine dehydrogenase subunit GcvPB [Planctomycetes bacterium]|nr:aminomethyl-transferring glycine dehydrogenase subunit GcvPB [Planctomycetota bacterium]
MSKLIFEESRKGSCGCIIPANDIHDKETAKLIPAKYLRLHDAALPEVNEITIVRHYTNLSKRNVGVDDSFYPLGSCTMKYNPKINESIAAMDGFAKMHPYQDGAASQGMLELMFELGEYLKEIAGMDSITLQPAAGAHGEFTGIKLIRAYLKDKGNPRKYILIPDSAHGTNPASVAFCGYSPIEIKSNSDGNVDLADLKSKLTPDVAAMMLTIPNTLGLFDNQIKEIAELLHKNGSFLYMDGANLNALMGIMKPSEAGVDVLHINLHKTFATPHGGGGPGAGPVACVEKLAPFLPIPVINKDKNVFSLDYDRPKSMGRVRAFYGNIAVLVKAYVYIRILGPEGIKRVSEIAVLNANYVMAHLKKYYPVAYERACMHECVLTGEEHHKKYGIRTLDIAKRLLDYGFHPPTIYFPLIVHEALMIEPTETESKQTLDRFIEVMIKIDEEAQKDPEAVKSAPHFCSVKRLDEVAAARNLTLRWKGKI